MGQLIDAPGYFSADTLSVGVQAPPAPPPTPAPKAKGLGERVLGGALLGGNSYSYPSLFSQDRTEQVLHFRHWTYCALNRLCEEVAGLHPQVGFVRPAAAGRRPAQVRKSHQALRPHEDIEHAGPGHPLCRLFDRPNQWDVAGDLWYELVLFLKLTGDAYLWTVPSRLGGARLPCELFVIPSNWVYPRLGRHGIDYYEVRPFIGPGMLRFPPEEVIHFHTKSPLHKLEGWSPQQAGSEWIDAAESVDRCRFYQFKNFGAPLGALQLGENYADPDDAEMERIYAKFFARIQGEQNYGRPIITPPGAQYVPLQIAPQEMAYVQSAEQLRDWVLSLFGVPKELVGIQPAGSDLSWYAPLQMFCRFTVQPLIRYLGQVLTRHLARRYDPELRVWWDDPTPDNPEQLNRDIEVDARNNAISVNEIRSLRGRGPWKYGDDPVTPKAGLPLPLKTGKPFPEELVPKGAGGSKGEGGPPGAEEFMPGGMGAKGGPATKAFDPDEPRDEGGEWTAGGASSGGKKPEGGKGRAERQATARAKLGEQRIVTIRDAVTDLLPNYQYVTLHGRRVRALDPAVPENDLVREMGRRGLPTGGGRAHRMLDAMVFIGELAKLTTGAGDPLQPNLLVHAYRLPREAATAPRDEGGGPPGAEQFLPGGGGPAKEFRGRRKNVTDGTGHEHAGDGKFTGPGGGGSGGGKKPDNAFDDPVGLRDHPGETAREFFKRVNGYVDARPDHPAFHDPARQEVEARVAEVLRPGQPVDALYDPRFRATVLPGRKGKFAFMSLRDDGVVVHGNNVTARHYALIPAGLSAEEADYRIRRALALKVSDEAKARYGNRINAPAPAGPPQKAARPVRKDLARAVIPLPDVRQSADYDCGAAALLAVLRHFGAGPGHEDGLLLRLNTSPSQGTSPDRLVRAARGMGLEVRAGPMTLEGLAAATAAGRPVVCPVQMDGDGSTEDRGHWVVVAGVTAKSVYTQDPAQGPRRVGRALWQRRWHDNSSDGTEYRNYGIELGAARKRARPLRKNVTDDSGHEHAGDGKFTGPGGTSAGAHDHDGEGPGAGEPAPADAWRDRQAARDAAREAADDARTAGPDLADMQAAEKAAADALDALAAGHGDVDLAADAARGRVALYAGQWQDNEDELREAGATEKELAPFARARAKAEADLGKQADAYESAARALDEAQADYNDVSEKEPPEPAEDDFPEEPGEPPEPDFPPEPDPGDEAAYPDGDAYDAAYAEWEARRDELQAAHEAAGNAYLEAHGRWEKDVEKVQGGWEKAHDRWEKDVEKAERKLERSDARAAERYESLTEALDEWDGKVGDAVHAAADAVHARLDREEKADPEPEDDDDDEK